jgi:hypothetical protein
MTPELLRGLQFFCRLPVSVHFVYELIDKCLRFQHWRSVIVRSSGLGVWSLWLVIVLLAVGCALLLLGPRRLLPLAFLALAVFQIPTSILFEDSAYESADSASALGGVFAVAVLVNLPPDSEQAAQPPGLSQRHAQGGPGQQRAPLLG